MFVFCCSVIMRYQIRIQNKLYKLVRNLNHCDIFMDTSTILFIVSFHISIDLAF